jgi:hypothetical protein
MEDAGEEAVGQGDDSRKQPDDPVDLLRRAIPITEKAGIEAIYERAHYSYMIQHVKSI